MQRLLVPVLALIALAILCLFCIRCHGPRILEDLSARSRQGLTAASLDQAVLDFDGRDATLTGSAASEAASQEAARIVAATWGVRSVDNRLAVAAASLAGVAARFQLDRTAEGFTLRGAVPSATARDRIAVQARELWGADRVTDQLEVDPAVEEPAWLGGLPDALRTIEQRTEGGSMAIDGDEATVRGRVFAETARQDLLDRLRQALQGLQIRDQLQLEPPSTPEELQETLDAAILGRTVEFATGSAELTAAGRKVLDEIFELLAGLRSLRIGIAGHTDSRGGAELNLDLSRRRAVAARDYLVNRGLAPDRFATSGFGGDRPVADNSTPEGQRKNRRIEFEVLEEPK